MTPLSDGARNLSCSFRYGLFACGHQRQSQEIVKKAVADAYKQKKIGYLLHRRLFVFDTFTEDELNNTFGRDVVERVKWIPTT
jgi:hypothetical protein